MFQSWTIHLESTIGPSPRSISPAWKHPDHFEWV